MSNNAFQDFSAYFVQICAYVAQIYQIVCRVFWLGSNESVLELLILPSQPLVRANLTGKSVLGFCVLFVS